MKVLLIDPTYNPGNIPLNLGLGRIEAYLKHSNIGVEVSDFVLSNKDSLTLTAFEKLEREFIFRTAEKAANYEVIYISGSHGMELKPYAMFPRIKALAETIKKVNPNSTIVMGGALANYYSTVLNLKQGNFKEFGIDQIVTGQEVNAAKNLVQALDADDKIPASTINKGLLRPTWESWELDKYPDYLSLMIRTGCPYTCSFCFEGAVYDPKIPQALPADIPAIVKALAPRRQFNSVMIEDSIAVSLPWFNDLKGRMASSGLDWAIYARSNEIVQFRDRLSDLHAAGCQSLIVGIESFEDELHKSTKKKITTNQTLEALQICKENNLAVQGCLILAFPDDTLTKIENRILAAQSLDLSTYRWHVLQPNWGKLPDSISGLEDSAVTDILDVQVSIPDSCIPEYLEKCPPMAMYDEHLLIRAIENNVDVPRLEKFGYKDSYNFRDFMTVAAPLVRSGGLPVNEDVMYEPLFDPNTSRHLVDFSSQPKTGLDLK